MGAACVQAQWVLGQPRVEITNGRGHRAAERAIYLAKKVAVSRGVSAQ
jgi:hypothetical protein